MTTTPIIKAVTELSIITVTKPETALTTVAGCTLFSPAYFLP
jgi:hypothetical protein